MATRCSSTAKKVPCIGVQIQPRLRCGYFDVDLNPDWNPDLHLNSDRTWTPNESQVWSQIQIQRWIWTRSAMWTVIWTPTWTIISGPLFGISHRFLAVWHKKSKLCLHVSGEIHLVNSYVMHYELLLDERYAIYREHEVKIYATN